MSPDELALALAEALRAHQPPLAESWTVGALPAQAEGDVPVAGLIAVAGGRPTVMATLDVLGAFNTLRTLHAQGPAPRYADWQVQGAGPVERVASELVAEVAAWAAAHPGQTNCLDAVVRVRALLAARLPPNEGHWCTETWSGADGASPGASVTLHTPALGQWRGVVNVKQEADGVTISVPQAQGAAIERRVRDAAELDAAAPVLLEAVQGWVAARDRFAARSFTAAMAAKAIAQALSVVRAPHGKAWKVHANEPDFPSPTPWAGVHYGSYESGPHLVATLEEGPDGVHIAAGHREARPSAAEEVTAANPEQLAAQMPRILEAVRRELGRLTTDRLTEGRIYRVLRAVGDPPRAAAGRRVRMLETRLNPRDSEATYVFRDVDAPERELCLCNWSDADLEVLRDLDLYLARED